MLDEQIFTIEEEISNFSGQTATMVQYIHLMRQSESDQADLFKELLTEYAESEYTVKKLDNNSLEDQLSSSECSSNNEISELMEIFVKK